MSKGLHRPLAHDAATAFEQKAARDIDLGEITVLPAGPSEATIAFVGQSPGETEERDGKPFVGKAGELLQEVTAEARLEWGAVWRTNVFKRRLYAGDEEIVQAAIRLDWRPRLLKELSELRRLRLAVTFGNEALYALVGKWGITLHRGRLQRSPYMPGLLVVPTVHPAAVLRRRDEWRGWLVRDLTRTGQIAKKYLQGPVKERE